MAGGTPGSAAGEPATGVLLGGHRVELGLQLVPCRQDGILCGQERDGAFELATVITQLVGRHRPEGMLGLFYCWREDDELAEELVGARMDRQAILDRDQAPDGPEALVVTSCEQP